MRKGIILAALLLASSSVFAADLSTVGGSGVQASAEYGYVRAFDSTINQAAVGVQANGGALGSVAASVGKSFTSEFADSLATTYSASYANKFDVGSVSLIGAATYTYTTVDGGSTASADAFSYTAAALFPVVKNLKGYGAFTYTPEGNGKVASAGLIYSASSKINVSVGYSHVLEVSNSVKAATASLSYKF